MAVDQASLVVASSCAHESDTNAFTCGTPFQSNKDKNLGKTGGKRGL